MSIVHIAFYPSDWLAGTRGMSAEETGVYITLIARMYEMAGPIVRDDKRLSRLCGCKSKTSFVRVLEYLIEEGKIVHSNGGLFNERVKKEIQKVTKKSSLSRQAAESRWSRKPNKNKVGTMQTHSSGICQPEPESEVKKEGTNVPSKKKGNRGTRLSPDWTLSRKNYDDAKSKGLSDDEIRHEQSQFRDYWISKTGAGATKLDWDATWRSWCGNAVSRRPNRPHNGNSHPMAQAFDEIKQRLGSSGKSAEDLFSQGSGPGDVLELEATRIGHPGEKP